MPATESMVRAFLPMRGGNMAPDDISIWIAAATQWVTGELGETDAETDAGKLAATLWAASIAQGQIDSANGVRNSTRAKDLSDKADTILKALQDISSKGPDSGEDATEGLVSNSFAAALFPPTSDDELITRLLRGQEVDDIPFGIYPYSIERRWPYW